MWLCLFHITNVMSAFEAKCGVVLSWEVPQPDPEQIKRRTYKLSPRTIQVIEQLAETEYGDPGQVLAASMKILKVKKLSSKYLADSE